MEARAEARYLRTSPQKARLVVDLIRGQKAGDAINILRTTNKRVAPSVEKVLRSAIANAENRSSDVDVDKLLVTECYVNEGPRMMIHQHFNTSPQPARYLAVAYGSLRYPFSAEKRALIQGVDVNVKDGGRQVEYEDEDPEIRRLFEAELRKTGAECRMRKWTCRHRS